MNQILSTLLNLGIYLSLVALGALLGSRRGLRSRPLRWMPRLQTAALMLLILALGVNLGSNEEVVASLGSLGLMALGVTLASMAGSLLCVFLARRFLLRLDRRGLRAGSPPGAPAEAGSTVSAAAGASRGGALTWKILLAVAAGILAGRFLLPDRVARLSDPTVQIGLYLLLFLVGLDLGRLGGILADIRAIGPRMLLIPLSILVGTLGAAALPGLLLPIGAPGAMAVTAGFGWYSIAPSLLAPYSLSLSAMAFLSNIFREVLAIILVPLTARHLGYLESLALPAATAMDTVLPVVVGATDERMAICSFGSGLLLSLLVPVLVPAIAGLAV